MTHVLHIITGLGAGGAESMLVRVVLGEQRRPDSRRQVVVSMMDEGIHGETLRAAGVELHCLGCTRGVPSVAALVKLIGLMRRIRPEVVMTWLYHADLAGAAASLISGLGTRRLIWNLRCSNMDLSRYSAMTRSVVGLLARMSRLPGAVSFNSHAGRDHHMALGYRPRVWTYLPNGFNLLEWRPDISDRKSVRVELGIGDQEIVVGMIARVDPMKDYPTFLAAAAILAAARQDVRFVLVGKGTESLADESGPLAGRLIALGERRDVARVLRAFDVGVLSSAFGEGFPNVIGEAMATGVPCVVTDVGDAGMIVGDTGHVVSIRSPEALAAAISVLADEPPQSRARRSKRARERIGDLYALERVNERYRELWSEVARNLH